MRTSAKPNRNIPDAIADLPASLQNILPRNEVRRILADHNANPTPESRQRSIHAAVPHLRQLITGYLRRRPNCPLDFDDLFGEGSVAIVRTVDMMTERKFTCDHFSVVAMKVFEALTAAMRRWTPGPRPGQPVRDFTRRFMKNTGRAPNGDEIDEFLRRIFHSKRLDVGRRPLAMVTLTDLEEHEMQAVEHTEDESASIFSSIFGREAQKLANKSFNGTDLKVFKMLCDGRNVHEICRAMHLNQGAALRRINGVLWAIKCNLELAAMVDAKADESPRITANGLTASLYRHYLRKIA